MAHISGFNKIMKLPRLALITNFYGYLQPASSAILVLSNELPQLQTNTTSPRRYNHSSHNTLQNTPPTYARFNQYKDSSLSSYRSYSSNHSSTTQSPPKSSSSPTIDEFRAREEQRDQEIAKQVDESPPDEDEQKREKVNAVRTKILEASLSHVATLGWSRKAIVQGAEDAGYPGVAHGMFPDGAIELVAYFYSKCNEDLLEQLKKETDNGQKAVSDPLDFLVRAVRTRLEMVLPYSAHWTQALAIMALPQNVPKSLAQLLTLVDDICYYSGDRAVDFGWYTRRVGLATIYKMTEMYMLQDKSVDHQETWTFLKNRMEEAAQIQMVLAQSDGMATSFQRSFNSAFVTARNILGVGYNRR